MSKECKHSDIRTRNKALTRFQCNDCGKWFNDKNVPDAKYRYATTAHNKAPRILLFDTETAPLMSYVWDVWQQNVAPVQIIHNWFLISWSAKWLNDSEIMGDVLTSEEAIKQDDFRIVKKFHQLLCEADIVIAHNGKKFDVPKVNTRFLVHSLNPPAPYQLIDTLLVARQQFDFTHNKLNFLAGELGIEHKKLETEFQLWKDCLAGKEEALGYMLKYNKMDVTVLEEVYLKLRPWVKPHPNLNLYTEEQGCATCGNPMENLIKRGTYATTVSKYDSYLCPKCGAYSRVGKSKGRVNLRSVAR